MLARGFIRSFLLPGAERLTRTRFWTYYTESLRFDRQESADREALRDHRLGRVWDAARATALHRRRLEGAGLPSGPVSPEEARALLSRLPPVAKAALRLEFPAGVTTGLARADLRYTSTAGTTDRMTVVADFCKRDHARAAELHALRLAVGGDVAVDTVEIPANVCNVVCGLEDRSPPGLLRYFWHALLQGKLFTQEARSDLIGRFERDVVMRLRALPPIAPMPRKKLDEVLDAYLEQIGRGRPLHLRGFPVYLLWLADRSRDAGRPFPGLRVASPFGGLASPAMAARIGDGLGCRFADKYGTSELGSVAAACGRGPGMHVFEDLFVVEVLRGGKPAGDGQVGRVVVTDLVNTAMPLVRYDVGDVGVIHAGPCPCGRKTARLEIQGRVQEVLGAPSGPLTASHAADCFFADPAVANFRLEEAGPGAFEAAVVAGGRGEPDLAALRDRFAALHGGVRKFRARVVPFVQPESSGKYRFVLPLPTDGALL